MELNEIKTLATQIPEDVLPLASINSVEQYERAADIFLRCKRVRKEIAATFKPIKDAQRKALNEAVEQERRLDSPFQSAERILNPAMISFRDRQEKYRKSHEAKLQQEVDSQAQEDQIQEAVAAEEAGDQSGAERILNQPVQAPPVILDNQTPKVSNVSFRKSWGFRIDREDEVKRLFLVPDLIRIGKQVRALGPKAEKLVGGIRVFDKTTTVGKT